MVFHSWREEASNMEELSREAAGLLSVNPVQEQSFRVSFED